MQTLCIYNEILLRIYRDVLKLQNNKSNNRFQPQFWFFNSDETKFHYDLNLQKFLIQNYNKFGYVSFLGNQINLINDKIKKLTKTKDNTKKIYLLLKVNKNKFTFDVQYQTTKPNEEYTLVKKDITTNKFSIFNYINYKTPIFFKVQK